MAACDKDLEALLKEMPAAEVKPVDPVAAEKAAKRQRKKASKNQPGFDIAGEMKRVAGVDLTRIDGIKLTVLTVSNCWYQGDDGPDADRRGRTGHESMADGVSLRIVDRVSAPE